MCGYLEFQNGRSSITTKTGIAHIGPGYIGL